MRRILVVMALAAAVMTGAACGSDDPSSGDGATTGGETANASAVCDQVKKINVDAGKKLADALGEFAAAQAVDDQTKIKAAEDKIKNTLGDWADKLTGEADSTNDPQVKKDVGDLAAAVRKLADDDGTSIAEVEAVRAQADKICP